MKPHPGGTLRGNSLFPGRNDNEGLMLCGYEWGWSLADQAAFAAPDAPVVIDVDAAPPHTFSDKTPRFGQQCRRWPYDQRILRWFQDWGHPLQTHGPGGDFEQSIVQTNWRDNQAHRLGADIATALLAPEAVDNFLYQIEALQPRLILFLGAQLMRALQHPGVLPRFCAIMGTGTAPIWLQKDGPGTRFRVGFQSFERVEVVGLPHPSGSRGLTTAYIAAFAPELSARLHAFKQRLRERTAADSLVSI